MSKDLIAVAFNAIMAAFSLWVATTQPDNNKLLDLWLGAATYCAFVAMAGAWLVMALEYHQARKLRV